MASIERMTDSSGFDGTETGLLPEAGGPSYLVARSAGQQVAIPLEETREIIAVKSLTRLPGAPAWVAGLLNLRGSVLTVIDLDVRLGGASAVGPVIVVELEGRMFGLRVTEVLAVQTATAAPGPVEAARSAEGVVSGMVPVGANAALVLDVAALQHSALAER